MLRILYQFPTWMQHLYRGVTWRRDASVLHDGKPVVYLTFDDGPIPEATPAILDILKQYDVRATFFVVGDNIQKYPHIYARVLSEGHRVGNHTFHHIKGTKTPLRLSPHKGESDYYWGMVVRECRSATGCHQRNAACRACGRAGIAGGRVRDA